MKEKILYLLCIMFNIITDSATSLKYLVQALMSTLVLMIFMDQFCVDDIIFRIMVITSLIISFTHWFNDLINGRFHNNIRIPKEIYNK